MRILITAVLFLAMSAPAATQAPAPLSAAVEGIVVDAITGVPVRDVTIVRRLPDPRSPETLAAIAASNGERVYFTAAENDAIKNPRLIQTVSDANGKYRLEPLDTGKISVTFSKPGYVNSYETLTIRAGQQVLNYGVRLTPMGVVSGRIVNASGDPVVSALISPLSYRPTEERTITLRSGTSTNDRGEFRLIAVLPGTYFFQVSTHRGIGLSGQPAIDPPSSPGGGLYPGVRSLSAAVPVEVRPGEETRLNDIVLQAGSYVPIRVRITNPAGEPAKEVGYRLANMSPTYPNPSSDGMISIARPAGPNLRQTERMESGATVLKTHFPIGLGNYEAAAVWNDATGVARTATTTFTFTGSEVDVDLALETPKGRLACRSMLEDLNGAVSVAANIRTTLRTGNTSTACNTSTQGRYSMAPIPAGRYAITLVSQLPPDTYLASASYGNQNALLGGVEVTSEETTLELLIRSGAAVLNGRVVGKQGPEKGFVILVPDSSIPGSTFLSGPPTATADQNGDFQIRNLAPGSYTLYTFSDRPADDFRGSEFSKKFEGQGRVVTLNRSDTVNVELNAIDQPSNQR